MRISPYNVKKCTDTIHDKSTELPGRCPFFFFFILARRCFVVRDVIGYSSRKKIKIEFGITLVDNELVAFVAIQPSVQTEVSVTYNNNNV